MARARARARVRPPRELVVEQLVVDGDELVVFSWTAPEAEPRRASRNRTADESVIDTLSNAERDVLWRIVRGESNATIARARKTATRTVANQVASLLRKTGAGSRFELIRRFSGKRLASTTAGPR